MEAAMIAYYATLKRDSRRTAWLAGPYATHAEALAVVDRAWLAACEADPFCHFDARGTASIDRPSATSLAEFPAGRLNGAIARAA
jgi:hypothetical protein